MIGRYEYRNNCPEVDRKVASNKEPDSARRGDELMNDIKREKRCCRYDCANYYCGQFTIE